jgi:thiamine biosynthesis protein ThiI
VINTILLRYGEIHLKGQNRPYFERLLLKNIKAALHGHECAVYKGEGRYYVEHFKPEDMPLIIQKLKKVFGLHSLSPAVVCDKEFETVQQVAKALLEEIVTRKMTFKVQARRSDKRYCMTSMQLNAALGGWLLEQFEDKLQVDVHHPDLYVNVEIRERAYVYVQNIPAAGGMPMGSNGKALLLLSGGIDSPVAGYMIAKRGIQLECVYFHSFPYTTDRAKEKVIELARLLRAYCPGLKLHVVDFTALQTELYEKCPQEQITILMRRMMMFISEGIAERIGAQALITGESLGQVASQTIESITVTNAAASLPVLRPLIGFDKLEIMDKSRQIGTYETSILPYEDCCTVFVPKHPVTKPKLKDILASEQRLDYVPLVEQAVESAQVLDVF